MSWCRLCLGVACVLVSLAFWGDSGILRVWEWAPRRSFCAFVASAGNHTPRKGGSHEGFASQPQQYEGSSSSPAIPRKCSMNAAIFARKTVGSRPTFQKGLAIGAGSLVILLVFSAGLGYWNTAQLRENDAWVSHTNEVLDALESVLSTMKDAETGQRGYLITGEDRYLEPYNAALAAIQESVQRVKHLTEDNPRQQARIPLLEEQISAKLKIEDRTIALRKKDPEAARQVVLTGEGKKVMDAIRAGPGDATRGTGPARRPRATIPSKLLGGRPHHPLYRCLGPGDGRDDCLRRATPSRGASKGREIAGTAGGNR